MKPIRALLSSGTAAERLLRLALLAYVVALCAAAALLFFAGDAFWPATLLLYGPRWVLALPAWGLLGLALLRKRRALAAASLGCVLVVLGGFADFNVPWSQLFGRTRGDHALRVVSFNAGPVDLQSRLGPFLQQVKPDVLVIEECNPGLLQLPPDIQGFELKRTHGVCVLSRFPIVHYAVRDPHDVWVQGGSGDISLARIEAPGGAFDLLAVHLETPREGFNELFHFRSPRGLIAVTEQRRHESELAREFARDAQGPTLVVGDFNLTEESRIYHRYWSQFSNAFSRCGWGYGHSKRTRWFGVRIDHVLMDGGWTCLDAALGPDFGSDHRPMVVDLQRVGGR